MTNLSLSRESATEYFRELVNAALAHQRLDVTELVAYYVVNLLSGFADGMAWREPGREEDPLLVRLLAAERASGRQRRLELRRIGDLSLFVSGYFPESLHRRGPAISYYIALGESAYGSLSVHEAGAVSDVFAELCHKFLALADVLSEVSERSGLTTNSDLLRVYERWVQTGSARVGRLLVERGLVPQGPASVQ